MEWILKSPQIHSAFASLGHTRGDQYHVNENTSSTLKDILKNILSEDNSLRTYRRTVSFGQNVSKDIIPLLMNAKDEQITGLIIKILMNLTIPVECLLPLDVTIKSDFGRHTVFELRNLLIACKTAFVDPHAVKIVIEYLKKNLESRPQSKLSLNQCENIHDCLTLLRNILHIVDDVRHRQQMRDHAAAPMHNQILWNLFSQGLDKIVIKLMTIPEAPNWSATMVQLIALLYKDQHVGKLQKLLNVWLETSLSESSEDNESNTSPQNRGSTSNSPILTTDQTTSDSSDNYGKANNTGAMDSKISTEGAEKLSLSESTEPSSDNSMDTTKDYINKENDGTTVETILESNDIKSASITSGDVNSSVEIDPMTIEMQGVKRNAKPSNKPKKENSNKRTNEEWEHTSGNSTDKGTPPPTKICKMQKKMPSEHSDCGYGTQIETRESISTSSNEDDRTKPVHTKPRNPKHKANTKIRLNGNSKTLEEDKRRKKMVKRGKSNILNVKGLQFHQPTDDDIAIVLKEFTVDFMLKGYSSLVRTLHKQILNCNEIEIDRCHFFWLLTYFLKFATQMDLDLDRVQYVLSYDVVSFLTSEGVNLCEQFELAVKYNKADLNIWRRKLHLVVTAIREFVQAVDAYKNSWSPTNDSLFQLQMYMWETEELRSLMVLLIRSYNSEYHDKQYLQDLVVTNHLLLLFFDYVIKLPGYTGKLKMIDHIRQFATPHMMWQYGTLLEDFETNGEFVNDCVFTIMHHVGGEVESLHSLYCANILHSFSSIKQSDYEICDHWTDLVEFVMNSFGRQSSASSLQPPFLSGPKYVSTMSDTGSICNGWIEDELSALGWNYMQSKNSEDVIGNVVKLYKDDGVLKSRASVIDELYKQNLIDRELHSYFTSSENSEQNVDDVRCICDELSKQGYGDMLEWVQNMLLEICYVKICLAKITADRGKSVDIPSAQLICQKFKHVISPIIYHTIVLNKTISLVPWNCRQNAICKDVKFIQLLTKLSFYMPVDSGMLFFRIPQMWTADVLYEKALKISNIDTSKLKFSISDISRESTIALNVACAPCTLSYPASEVSLKMPVLPIPEHCYRIHRFKQVGAMVQYTPTPEPSVAMENTDLPAVENNPSKVDWMTLIKRAQQTKMPVLNSSHEVPKPSPVHNGADKSQSCDPVLSSAATIQGVKIETTGTNLEMNAPESQPDPSLCAPGPSHRLRPAAELPNLEVPSLYEEDSTCDTASVASDFSRMYVSDEDERLELVEERRFCFHDLFDDEVQEPRAPQEFSSAHALVGEHQLLSAPASSPAHSGSPYRADSAVAPHLRDATQLSPRCSFGPE